MNIQIKTSGGFGLTPAVSEYVEKRLAALDKFVAHDPVALCVVDLGRTTKHHKHGDIFRAEIHFTGTGRDLYTSSEKADLYMAIDDARDEIVRELSSAKAKKISSMRRGGAKVKNFIKGLWTKNDR